METNDEIDKLFSTKFENYKVDSTEDEWMKLNSELKRINFLKFQVQSFNIFYLIGIIGIAALIVFFIINHSPSQKQGNDKDSIHLLQPEIKDTIAPSQDSDFTRPENPTPVKMTRTGEPTPVIIHESGSDSVKNAKETLSPQTITVEDSVKTNPETMTKEEPKIQSDSTKSQPRIRKVKRTTVVKSDAVIVRDTVDVTKKQK